MSGQSARQLEDNHLFNVCAHFTRNLGSFFMRNLQLNKDKRQTIPSINNDSNNCVAHSRHQGFSAGVAGKGGPRPRQARRVGQVYTVQPRHCTQIRTYGQPGAQLSLAYCLLQPSSLV
ncbi:hypothetical protein RRG08_041184 [Elysia crispata]|uniref:Uncharacterized protein n=1 Tax=Elysia crispata TaxID=231223 RepID=A0AAE0XXU7_9GAST|nr:hypothetical protein RRG08_041184 [Elysia crispata]